MRKFLTNSYIRLKGKHPKDDNNPFHLSNGTILKDIEDFIGYLPHMTNDVFYHHVTENRNDFATWIKYSLNMPALGKKIEHLKSKTEVIDELQTPANKHIIEKEAIQNLLQHVSKAVIQKEKELEEKKRECEDLLKATKKLKPKEPEKINYKDIHKEEHIDIISHEIINGKRALNSKNIERALKAYRKIIPAYNALEVDDKLKIFSRIQHYINELKEKIDNL